MPLFRKTAAVGSQSRHGFFSPPGCERPGGSVFLWACYTQEEIVEAVGIPRQTITDFANLTKRNPKGKEKKTG